MSNRTVLNCAHCGRPIIGQQVTAGGFFYHFECARSPYAGNQPSPGCVSVVPKTVGDVVLRQPAHELVEALDETNWSSWQTTARFQNQLDALRELLNASAGEG